jgi:hypothetical protein
MKTIGFALCLLALCGAAGCGTVTPDTMASVAAAGMCIAGQAAVPKPLSVENAKKTVLVVEEIMPVAQAAQTPDDLATGLIPALTNAAVKYIHDPTVRAIVVGAIAPAVSLAQAQLNAHPDIGKQMGVAGHVAYSALQGLRNGLNAAILAQEAKP